MPNFIAIFRADFLAESEIQAIGIAETIRSNAEIDLDLEVDHDEVTTLQLTPLEIDVRDEAVLLRLRQTRNDLIRTKIRECWDMASELNRMIHSLKVRLSLVDAQVSYDWSSMISLTTQILQHQENPLDD